MIYIAGKNLVLGLNALVRKQSVSRTKLISQCIDQQAKLQGEDGENEQQRKQTKDPAKERNVKNKKPEQQTEPLDGSRYQWSMTHIAGTILGMICFIVMCVVVLKRGNGRTHGNNFCCCI